MSACVSTVIVSYNTRDMLDRCLASLRAGVGKRSLQVIVVDNGSDDGSVEMVKRRHPGTVLIEAGENLGFGRATNLGTARAEGKWIVWLNSDCEVAGDSLEKLCAYLEEHAAVGAVGPLLLHPDGRVQPSAQAFPTAARLLGHFLGLRRLAGTRFMRRLLRRAAAGLGPFMRGYLDAFEEDTGPRRVDWLSGACIATPAEVLRSVGLFDEAFFMYSEDTDWCHRVRDAGYEIHQVPESRVVHHVGASRSRNPEATVHYYRSLYLYYERHRPGSMALVRLLMAGGSAARGVARWLASLASRERRPNPWWRVLRICWRGDPGPAGAIVS